MLIQAKEHIREIYDSENFSLYGQDAVATTWAMCKMNMILHGVPNADIQNEDTLETPLHTEEGRLKQFDRVIANPPFSQNYKKSELTYKERFSHFMPESGKKGDYMFVQHMIASLKSSGKMGVVMPHGVLFRSGEEGKFREYLIKERKILEAVVGLPSGLFYGTGIPACLLIVNKAKTSDEILFINADAEYKEGKNQNLLRPEDIEKINTVYHNALEIEGYSRLVSLDEVEKEDFNLNIRRYVDNTPPAEPHDVRAHLCGGIPKSEWNEKLMGSYAVTPKLFFDEQDADYYRFSDAIATKDAIRTTLEGSDAFKTTDAMIHTLADAWFTTYMAEVDREDSSIAELYQHGYTGIETAFEQQTHEVVNRFKIRGIFAAWWVDNKFTIKSIKSSGYDYGLLRDAYITGSAKLLEAFDEEQLKLHAKLTEQFKKLKNAKEENEKVINREKTDAMKEALFAPMGDMKTFIVDDLREQTVNIVERYLNEQKQAIIKNIENLWDKYRASLSKLEAERDEATAAIKGFLTELGYQ
jgi:type I restriction enzyme M protein